MAYQTAAEIRTAVPDLADTTKFPSATLERYVASFEEIVEDYRGVAFSPRTGESFTTIVAAYTRALSLPWPRIRSITSVTVTAPAVGGTATVIDSADYAYDPVLGALIYPAGFSEGSKAVVVFAHGYDAPPDTLVEATLEYVRSRALQGRSGVPRDVISQNVEGLTTRFSTPDKAAGRPTGYLDVDRMLNALPAGRIGIS